MNKHSIITAVAVAVIVIPFAYSAMSIIGTQQLEYRWNSPGDFSFFTMSNHGDVEFCNTIPFWTNFQKFEVGVFYESKYLGSYVAQPTTINPMSSAVQEGIFSSESISESQHVFMTMDFQFDGGTVRLDPNQFMVIVSTDTPILGIIPYSSTTQITGFDFDEMMNAENLSCD